MGDILLKVPEELHNKMKHLAIDQSTTVSALILEAMGQYHGPDFTEKPFLGPLESGPYSKYEVGLAVECIRFLRDVRVATYAELAAVTKPKLMSTLVRMLQVCESDGFIQIDMANQKEPKFVFVKAPEGI